MAKIETLRELLLQLTEARGFGEVRSQATRPSWKNPEGPYEAGEPYELGFTGFRTYRTGWLGLKRVTVRMSLRLKLLQDGNIVPMEFEVEGPPTWAVSYDRIRVLEGERFVELVGKKFADESSVEAAPQMWVVNTPVQLLEVLRTYDRLARELGCVQVFTA